MANKFFVQQKKHFRTGNWDNTIHVKDTEEQAHHQFHAFMSTYAYGFAPNDSVDYAAASIVEANGNVIRPDEVWNVMPVDEEPTQNTGE